MVLGLLDHLRDAPGGREDLYKLGGPLGLKLDDLLPVTEAAKRLGLVTIASGDIELTDEGRAWPPRRSPRARSGWPGACRACPSSPRSARRWTSGRGTASSGSAFLDRLRDHFSPPEAERQLQTALDWARYGEVFDFDPDSEDVHPGPRGNSRPAAHA
jgi:NitT/TauT family transport system ATP-binding protein